MGLISNFFSLLGYLDVSEIGGMPGNGHFMGNMFFGLALRGPNFQKKTLMFKIIQDG
jgi:hypothetical protein